MCVDKEICHSLMAALKTLDTNMMTVVEKRRYIIICMIIQAGSKSHLHII